MKILRILSTFLPWLVYGALSFYSKPIAIIVSLLITLGDYKKLKKGLFIEWGTFFFFSLSLILVVFMQNKWFEQHSSIFISATFALISWFSLWIQQPFTAQYAKEQVDKEYWNSFLFLRINTLMTRSFGVLFLFMTALNSVRVYHPNLITFSLVMGLSIILKISFINRFPYWYKKRYFSKMEKQMS